jgi:hypothetical protein
MLVNCPMLAVGINAKLISPAEINTSSGIARALIEIGDSVEDITFSATFGEHSSTKIKISKFFNKISAFLKELKPRNSAVFFDIKITQYVYVQHPRQQCLTQTALG